VIALLHGDAPFGWQGFAFAALAAIALYIAFNELAKATLAKWNRKRERRAKTAKKLR
jgi:heme exporter protein D